MNIGYLHSSLAMEAAKWLKQHFGCQVSLISPSQFAGHHHPDVFALWDSVSIIAEVVTSQQELEDKLSQPWALTKKGVGVLRYFVCPAGAVQSDDVPDSWGLLEVGLEDMQVLKGVNPLTENISPFAITRTHKQYCYKARDINGELAIMANAFQQPEVLKLSA